jgi:uncharacterized membrane protein
MTTNRKPKVQITIHHGKIVPTVKAGHWLHAEGFTALLIIAIISIVKLVKIITCLIWNALALVTPPLTRFVLRQAAGLYLGFRAFYTH